MLTVSGSSSLRREHGAFAGDAEHAKSVVVGRMRIEQSDTLACWRAGGETATCNKASMLTSNSFGTFSYDKNGNEVLAPAGPARSGVPARKGETTDAVGNVTLFRGYRCWRHVLCLGPFESLPEAHRRAGEHCSGWDHHLGERGGLICEA